MKNRRCVDCGVFVSLFTVAQGTGGVVASETGLVEVFTPFAGLSRETMAERIAGFYPGARSDSELTTRAADLLGRYFAGERVIFDLPLDLSWCTAFQRLVYEAVALIPYGEVRSYAGVAAGIGRERAARGVGATMARNPLPIVIPCHRVVGVAGALTGYSAPGGINSKKMLLELENWSGKIGAGA